MKGQSQTVVRVKEEPIVTKIGDAADFRKKMSAAIAKRAYEIYQRQGRRLGRDQENWRLAESEILQPLCCGMLHSNDGIAISLFCTAMGAKKLREIEVFVEPHRLILVGKNRSGSEAAKDADIYRVVPLKEAFDPSSVKLRQRGSLLEIDILKLRGDQHEEECCGLRRPFEYIPAVHAIGVKCGQNEKAPQADSARRAVGNYQ